MRWLTRDPMEEDGGANLYGFLENNQVSLVDVLGFFSNQYQTMVWGIYWYPQPDGLLPPKPPARPPRSSSTGTFRETILDFLDGGAGTTYHYYYPQHSATVRLLSQPDVAKVWKKYKNVKRLGYFDSGIIEHRAKWHGFIRDVFTQFGTNFSFFFPNLQTFQNNIYLDVGYEALGSFSGTYTISTDSRVCTKKFKMTLSNTWSLRSLTRNPFSGKSFLSERTLDRESRFWGDVVQFYHYNVIEPISRER